MSAKAAAGRAMGARRDRRAAARVGLGATASSRHIAAALACHRVRDLAGTIRHCQAALAGEPENPAALHLLGVAHHQDGDYATAAGLLRWAAANAPGNAEIRSNLGAALHAAGDHAGAVAAFRDAVRIAPGYVEGHANLAAALVRLGRIDEAIGCFAMARRLKPAAPRFAKRLGELCLDRARLAEAAEWFAAYLAMQPDDADACNNAALACERLGRLAEAEAHYRAARSLRPDSPEIANNLAGVLQRRGNAAEAEALFDRALAAPPDAWEDPANRAGALCNRGDFDRAIALYDALCIARPRDARLHAGYARALTAAGRHGEAAVAYDIALSADPGLDFIRMDFAQCLLRARRIDRAIEILEGVPASSPDHARARFDLCYVLAGAGRHDDALAVAQTLPGLPGYEPGLFLRPYVVMRDACDFDGIDRLDIAPAAIADANLASSAANFLELLPWADSDDRIGVLADLHRRWGRAIAHRADAAPLPDLPASRPGGPLRLGFVSSDLRSHSVARFVMPLFEYYDRARFDIVCYAPRADEADPIQRRIRDRVAAFRTVGDLADRDLACAIRADAIDILFELNGLTAESRLPALAYRPAPVQIYWLGYPFTTGLPAMDYILVDPHYAAERPDWLVETMLPLPGCWVCYDAFETEPVASEPPSRRAGHITFGSLSNPYKFTRRSIALWAEAMRRVEGSRFRFVNPRFGAGPLAHNVARAFACEGIGRDRLDFVDNRAGGTSHFAAYAEIDIALDTFPLTGGTTTADALWMGVPVVTCRGPGLHQRLSHSMLMNVGLADMSCADDAAFVETAARLAADGDLLARLRRELRPLVRSSALGAPQDYAAGFCKLMEDVAARHRLR